MSSIEPTARDQNPPTKRGRAKTRLSAVEARAEVLAKACWRLSEATSEAAFHDSMRAVTKVLGASAYYVNETRKTKSHLINRLLCSLTPTEMELIKKDYAEDPIAAHLRTSHLPIYWDRQTFVEADQVRLWEEHAEVLSLTHGIAFAIHLSKDHCFVFAADWTDTAPLAPSNRAWAVTAAQTVALYAQPAAARIWNQNDLQMTVSPQGITDRQIECLLWASRGRTDAEIGRILEISARTARKHIDNFVEQLGASSRTEAVAIATTLGLLQATDLPSVDSVVQTSKLDAMGLTWIDGSTTSGVPLRALDSNTQTERSTDVEAVDAGTAKPRRKKR